MEGLAQIGFNLPGLLIQIFNFVILLIILRLVAYKPIMRMLDERSARVKESMERVEQIKLESARTEETIRAQLEMARREGQALIAQAGQTGDRLKEEARQEARKDAEALIVRARSEIQMEREEAMDELRRQFAGIAILAAEKVINESLDRQTHQRLIDEVLEESLKSGGDKN